MPRTQHPTLLASFLHQGQDPHSVFSLSDIYVFGVGPLVNQENINALASKKDKEKHVFRLQDLESLEDVFIQMLGRKLWKAIRRWSGNSALPRPLKVTHSSTPPKALAVWKPFLTSSTSRSLFLLPGTFHPLISESQDLK